MQDWAGIEVGGTDALSRKFLSWILDETQPGMQHLEGKKSGQRGQQVQRPRKGTVLGISEDHKDASVAETE